MEGKNCFTKSVTQYKLIVSGFHVHSLLIIIALLFVCLFLQCKECGRGFSVRYNLLMHIQTIHSQPQKYKCPMRGCKDAFHSQSRLNGHLRRIHKKDWKSL